MSRQLAPFLVAAVVAVAGCMGPSATPSSAPASAAATPTASKAAASVAVTPAATATPAAPTPALPVAFTSIVYGYGITVPAGWVIGAALLRWDAASSPGHQDASVDKFISPSGLSAFAYAGPVSVDLAGFAKDNIAWTVRDHGDTCPATAPETTEPIEIGGESGTLQSWDCGILINDALLVRDGTGFVMVMRDLDVKAATDPADRAILDALVNSITFPN